MKAHVDLKLQPADKAALRVLTDEERAAVVDDLLEQVREDLEWVIARAAVPEVHADIVPPRPQRLPSLPRRGRFG